jgi:hypothetical protein
MDRTGGRAEQSVCRRSALFQAWQEVMDGASLPCFCSSRTLKTLVLLFSLSTTWPHPGFPDAAFLHQHVEVFNGNTCQKISIYPA